MVNKNINKVILFILLFIHLQSCINMDRGNSIHSVAIYSNQYFELAKAMNDQDLKKIDEIVKTSHLNLNFADSINKLSLLNWCVINDKPRSFKKLLKLGADPNWTDTTGEFGPAIIYSSQDRKNSDYLILAIKHGGNPNIYSSKAQAWWDFTPILSAIYSKRLENVKILVTAGADVNYTPKDFCNPLVNAMEQDDIEIVKYLLLSGSDCSKATLKRDDGQVVGVLFFLREMPFPLNSENYKTKLEVIGILKSKGLDYWSYPIPENIKESFKDDPNFLSKY
jgi:ankyrin repeat protein